MVEFSVGFDTSKQDGVCKEIIDEKPNDVLELIRGTEGGNEHAVCITVTGSGWYSSNIAEGDERQITGDIIDELWFDSMGESEDYNANTSDIYFIHTHPSGLAGMSFYDIVTTIRSATRAAPITGNFVITQHRGRVKANGLTISRDKIGTQKLEDALNRANTLQKTVEAGHITNNQAKSRLISKLEGLFEPCSYMTSVSDVEKRAKAKHD